MAGPILNLTMFTRSRAHTLRALSLASFPPAFIMFLTQGILSNQVNPAMGLLPLFISSAYSAFLLANEKKCGCNSSGLTGTPIHLVFDLVASIGLTICLILTWVYLPHSNADGGLVMLGTYCSNFLVGNLLIHFYFMAKMLHDAVVPGANYATSCPQCQFGPFTSAVQKGLRGGYAQLLDGDGPREEEGYAAEEV